MVTLTTIKAPNNGTAMKPPLYKQPPPLQRSISSQDTITNNSLANDDSHHTLYHRSASLDTPGTVSRVTGEFGRSYSVEVSSGSTDGACTVKPPPLPPPSFLVSSSKRSTTCKGFSKVLVPRETVDSWDRLFCEGLNADVCIYTEDGGMTAAHSFVLAASSPVFKQMLQELKPGKHHKRAIHILGVPYDAGRVFTRFLYSSRYEREEMEKYVMHLLVLSHVYSVPVLKRICTEELEKGLLNNDNVVDVLKLARLCDATRLNLLCLRLIVNNFKTVVKSDGWRVMRESDQTLEQELVGHVIEADAVRLCVYACVCVCVYVCFVQKKQEKLRKREEEKVYKQLHDAMEALVHICRDGCRTIGPQDGSQRSFGQVCNFAACKGLESLVRHFAGCRTKVSGGCVHCKRMWQLLELHSRMCGDCSDSCKVPLCKHFKDRIGQQTKKEEARWKLLVSKVAAAAKGTSTGFSLAAVSATLEQET